MGDSSARPNASAFCREIYPFIFCSREVYLRFRPQQVDNNSALEQGRRSIPTCIHDCTESDPVPLRRTTLRSDRLNWTESPWIPFSLLDQEIYEQLQSKAHVFSDSALCLSGKGPPLLRSDPNITSALRHCWWASGARATGLRRTHHGPTTRRSPEDYGNDKVHPYNSKGRILLMSMYNDIHWDQQRNEKVC